MDGVGAGSSEFAGGPVDVGHGRLGRLDAGGRCRDARDGAEKRGRATEILQYQQHTTFIPVRQGIVRSSVLKSAFNISEIFLVVCFDKSHDMS